MPLKPLHFAFISSALFFSMGCQNSASPKPQSKITDIRFIFTTDEHGWLEPGRGKGGTKIGGSVALAAHLTKERSEDPNKKVFLFSLGDMWTGPYLSTLLKGAPVVDTMNALQYDGAVIGNHDFDFGQEQLATNVGRSNFPYLAANIKTQSSQQIPAWTKPYHIYDVKGFKMGVLGLANEKTPETTDTKNLDDLIFTGYVDNINYWVPKMRSEGANEIVILVHDHPAEKLNDLVFSLVKNHVRILGLGHAHRSHKEIFDPGTPTNFEDDVIICNAGAYMRNYCRIDLLYRQTKLLHRAVEVIPLTATPEQKENHKHIQELIDDAHHQVDDYAQLYITTLKKDILRKDDVLGGLIVESWLNHFSDVDVAITNRGAIRQDLHHGEVRVRDVISVLPFENTLVIVTITGKQLKDVLLKKESLSVGAMYHVEEDNDGVKRISQLMNKLGNPISDDQKVRVVINEFMYRGGDGYPFAKMDSQPELTAVNWRSPVVEKLKEIK